MYFKVLWPLKVYCSETQVKSLLVYVSIPATEMDTYTRHAGVHFSKKHASTTADGVKAGDSHEQVFLSDELLAAYGAGWGPLGK